MEKLLDIFCSNHGITRYELAKVTGISEQTWRAVNNRELAKYTVKQLTAMGMVTGMSPDKVLEELWSLNLAGSLNGLRPYLDKYDLHDVRLERQVYDLIDQLAMRGVHLQPFSFNRFDDEMEQGDIKNPKAALRRAVKNLIAFLQEQLKVSRLPRHVDDNGTLNIGDDDSNGSKD
ncbi:MAG: hypothetical protein LKG24_00900 [Lacticaseibacillus songhuajiangensis]|jgi:DNA-binding XRE family transcriptional regulator|nr:hypothetical protein [Lacticaseibacillus songhuajiangensis]